MSDRVSFVLPSIVDKGLLESDTQNYSLVMYPKAVALTVSTTLVDCLATTIADIKLDTPERINFAMEFLGVALATPMNQVRSQVTARTIYADWIHNPEFMGDTAMQNRYFRKIIRHLSQPFTLEGADAGLGEFMAHFVAIFEIYRDLCQLHCDKLEEETWSVLLSTAIGISDHLLNLKRPQDVNEAVFDGLKTYSLECLFVTFFSSKTKNPDIWEKFHTYGWKWSRHDTFVKHWGKTMSNLFDMIGRKIYGLPFRDETDAMMVKYLEIGVFAKALDSVDIECSELSVKAREYIAGTAWNAAEAAVAIARESTSGIFELKFPADSFLKLFGPLINFFPKEQTEYDGVLAINLKTMCLILKQFDLTNCNDLVFDLISGFLPYIGTSYPKVLNQFVLQSNVFFKDKKVLPMALEIASKCITLSPGTEVNPEFLSKVIGLTLTQFSVTRNSEKVEELAELFWSNSANLPLVMEMLHCAEIAGVTPSKYLRKQLETEKDGAALSAIGFYLACSISRGKLVDIDSLFGLYLERACEFTTQYSGYDILVVSTLQLLYSVAIWAPSVYRQRTNVELFFKFYRGLNENVSKAVTVQEENKGETWIDRRQVHLKFLLDLVLSKLNVHFVRRDYISRTLGDERNINESSVIKDERITLPKITYVMVGEDHLLSFIEGSGGELYVVCRGAFGKSIWQIIGHDDGIAEPVIEREKLSPLSHSSDVDLLVRKNFLAEYERWLNWETVNFGAPDYAKNQCRRSRTSDFLICGGIVDASNSRKVRILSETEALKKSIQQLDELCAPHLTTVPVIHFTDTDTPVADSWKNRKQVSPALLSFLRTIGDPIVLPHTIATEYSLPKMRTSVASLLGNDFHLIAFMTPAMAQDESGAKAIANMASTSDVVIMFNEGGRDLVLGSEWAEKVVIEIKPVFQSFFLVSVLSAPSYVFKPVSSGTVLDGHSVRLSLCLFIEQMLSVRKESAIDSLKPKRDEIMKNLIQGPVSENLANEVVTKCAKA